MDTEQKKKLGEIQGEYMNIADRKRLNDRSSSEFIVKLLQKRDPVEFKPSPYWAEKVQAGDREALESSLMEDSASVTFDRLSDENPADGRGYILSIGWDKEVEDVVAEVYVIPERETRRVHLGNIKTLYEVGCFLASFA